METFCTCNARAHASLRSDDATFLAFNVFQSAELLQLSLQILEVRKFADKSAARAAFPRRVKLQGTDQVGC